MEVVEKLQVLLSNELSETRLDEKILAISTGYSDNFSGDAWKADCIGRNVLREFASLHGDGVGYEHLRNSIIVKMARDGFQPQGMKSILDDILLK